MPMQLLVGAVRRRRGRLPPRVPRLALSSPVVCLAQRLPIPSFEHGLGSGLGLELRSLSARMGAMLRLRCASV